MITALLVMGSMLNAALPPLHVQGKSFVDGSGKKVVLKGCNVGNWLVNEFWMWGLGNRPHVPGDQYSLEQLLTKRFGTAEDERLMNLLRTSWMGPRDWNNIKTYGFNLVRVPFNYRLLEDDARPKQLRADAWRWIDEAVDQAEKHGLYVILDLHGVQGGQTMNDHTGRSGQNKLWSVPENQERMAWLWTKIAQRYRKRSAVIAYDPINEPYGGEKPQVVAVFSKAYDAIRSVDPDKLIFAPGHYDNFDHYGDPKDHGWHNVGIQMHYYPGMFGDSPKVKSNLRHLNSLKAVAAKIDRLNVPFLVGEMNVVMKSTGGATMMRQYFDAHASYGWLTTMWSYKVITDEGGTAGGSWGMFTNADKAIGVDFETSPESEIESYFRSFATQKLMAYKELQYALATPNPVLEPLPAEKLPRTKAPKDDVLSGWTTTDIGDSLRGGLVLGDGGAFDLYGGGDDIWAERDQFRFLHKNASGDFQLSVTVATVEETGMYTKAGLMIRSSLNPDAPCLVLSIFPSGECEVALRDASGAKMAGIANTRGGLPNAKMSIVRNGDTFILEVNSKEVLRRAFPTFTGPVLVGPFALSHDNGDLTKIGYKDLSLK